jgi:hypothetical protein
MKRKENNHYYIYIIMILIGILIFCLIFILCWQIIAALLPLREGLESDESNQEPAPIKTSSAVYQPYNASAVSNNADALPKQNATNIDYLNGQIIDLNNSNIKIQQSIGSMQTQIDSLTHQQVEYAQSIGTPDPAE